MTDKLRNSFAMTKFGFREAKWKKMKNKLIEVVKNKLCVCIYIVSALAVLWKRETLFISGAKASYQRLKTKTILKNE